MIPRQTVQFRHVFLFIRELLKTLIFVKTHLLKLISKRHCWLLIRKIVHVNMDSSHDEIVCHNHGWFLFVITLKKIRHRLGNPEASPNQYPKADRREVKWTNSTQIHPLAIKSNTRVSLYRDKTLTRVSIMLTILSITWYGYHVVSIVCKIGWRLVWNYWLFLFWQSSSRPSNFHWYRCSINFHVMFQLQLSIIAYCLPYICDWKRENIWYSAFSQIVCAHRVPIDWIWILMYYFFRVCNPIIRVIWTMIR